MQSLNRTLRVKWFSIILVGFSLPFYGWAADVLMEEDSSLKEENNTSVEQEKTLMEEIETLMEKGEETLMEGVNTLMEADDESTAGQTLLEDGSSPTAVSTEETDSRLITQNLSATSPNDNRSQTDNIICKDKDVCRQNSTGLPLRALPRAMSALYSGPNTASQILSSNVKAFWPLYVFARKDLDLSSPTNPKGWYQVGTMIDDPVGWMQAKDILEWKQSLLVSYTHPGIGDERRNSVLMFDTKAALQTVAEADERETQVQTMLTGLNRQPIEVPNHVISREPSRFVNIDEKFYLLPVIDFEQTDIFDDETRYLQIAAAIPRSRADEANPDTLNNRKFAEQAAQTETVTDTQAKTLGLDIKFVMDMTGSMGPFIKRTKDAIAKVATMIAKENLDVQVRFGLIGYRDDLVTIPGLKFVTNNFTPTLVTVDEFDKVIAKASPATDTSGDYQEEPFAGINLALNSDWNDNTLKFVILVGDASSHPVSHQQNTTGLDAVQLRELANGQKINIISIHLKASRFKADHALAERQFTTLAENKGSQSPAYLAVAAHKHEEFELAVKNVATALSKVVAKVRQGNIEIVKKTHDTTTIVETQEVGTQAEKIAEATAANALVDYLGNVANPPRDITAWVMDRDLVDPTIRALQVRVLLKKRELNDLIQALEKVLKAVKRSQLTSMQFFDALQGVVTQTTKGGDNKITMESATRLADSGLMPAWINSLPYKSAILEMSNELFEALSAEERANLEYEIEAKLQLYREINENSDLWVKLDERDASIDHVYPLSLTALP
jgi:serine/threonine-protein kinase PpkA